MSSPQSPRKDGPRLVHDGEVLRLQQFNGWINGSNFRGGFLFQTNRRWAPTFFSGMNHLTFLRNPENDQIRLSEHERLENYRVIYYPVTYFLNLVDYSITPVRGIILKIALLTLRRPNTTEIEWAGLTSLGTDMWCTDVVLAGCDMSHQIWLRHVPTGMLYESIEECERWLFGMNENDEMVVEI